EKDYVLNWILAGISNQVELSKTWIFKGGTCLKKCFFKDYRFSEDLDFTLIDKSHLNNKFLQEQFHNISVWIYEQSGIEIPSSQIRFEIYNNPRGNLSIEGRVSYRGPMQRKGNLSRIKLDLTTDEKIVLKPEERDVYHPYGDTSNDPIIIQSYCLEEIFAEKLRALIERLRPRDLYDVIHLYHDQRWQPNRHNLLNSLQQKCAYKKVALPTLALLESKPEKSELITEWENMLAHQINNLRPFDYYWQQLPGVLNWIYGEDGIYF
ncbi:MAG: nucleotidyl transferase AbiEii/AbiGii toxin family protein, partial [Gammaproteobacteria bacterium]